MNTLAASDLVEKEQVYYTHLEEESLKATVAELDGYTDIAPRSRYNGIQDYVALCGVKGGVIYELPYFQEDSNAMNDIEGRMDDTAFDFYRLELLAVVMGHHIANTAWLKSRLPASKLAIRATARMRAEAFVRVNRRWPIKPRPELCPKQES